MNNDPPVLSLLFAFAALVAAMMFLFSGVYSFIFPPSEFEVWKYKVRAECHGQGGDRFAVTNQIAVCTRKPFMRMPKVLFEKEYGNEKE